MSTRNEILVGLGVLALIFCVLLGPRCVASDDFSAPRRAAETQGYKDVRVVRGHALGSFNGCGENEVAYDATAINPAQQKVSIVVCCGVFFKGCTVRTR